MKNICSESNRVATQSVRGPAGRRKLAGGKSAAADAATGGRHPIIHPPRMGRWNGGLRCVSRAPAGAHEIIGVVFRGRRCACTRLISGNPPGWRTNGGVKK